MNNYCFRTYPPPSSAQRYEWPECTSTRSVTSESQVEDERPVPMDLARPTFPHLPGDEFCERAVRRDHGAPPLWPITWTSPPRCEPASPFVPPNNKGHILPIEVRRLEKHGCEIDVIHP